MKQKCSTRDDDLCVRSGGPRGASPKLGAATPGGNKMWQGVDRAYGLQGQWICSLQNQSGFKPGYKS